MEGSILLSQGHRVSKQRCWDTNTGSLASKSMVSLPILNCLSQELILNWTIPMGQTLFLGLSGNLLIDPHNLFPIKGKFQRWGNWDADTLDRMAWILAFWHWCPYLTAMPNSSKLYQDSNIINAKITVNRSTQNMSHTGKYRFYFISQSVFYGLFGVFMLRVLLLRSLGNTS